MGFVWGRVAGWWGVSLKFQSFRGRRYREGVKGGVCGVEDWDLFVVNRIGRSREGIGVKSVSI